MKNLLFIIYIISFISCDNLTFQAKIFENLNQFTYNKLLHFQITNTKNKIYVFLQSQYIKL